MEKIKKQLNLLKNKLKIKKNNKIPEDFNFFLPYLGRKKSKDNKLIYGGIFAIVLVVFFVGNFVWSTIKIEKLKKEISQMNNEINSNKNKEKLVKAAEINKRYNALKKYYDGVSVISSEIDKKQVVSNDLIMKISSTLPAKVSFKKLTIQAKTLNIEGTSESRVNIAEFQYNLKNLKEIKNVEIFKINGDSDEGNVKNIITSEKNNYSFSLKCTLKDVDKDENK